MRKSIFLPLILLTGFSLTVTTGWVLKRNDGGIAIYTKFYTNSDVKAVRTVDTVQASLSSIAAVLLDTKNYTSWIYHCSEARTLKLVNEREQYKYVKTSLPWPFDDRELVSYSRIFQDSVTKVVTFITAAAPDFIPENNRAVRIKDYQSVYTLTPLQKGYVKIELEFHANPGGSIPIWLINANIVSGPYITAFEMRKRFPQYKTAQYSFIKEMP